MDYHALLSGLVIALSLAGYIPYLWSIVQGRNKPHIYTWISGTLTASIAGALQVLGGAGVGSWPMFVVAFLSACIVVLGFWRGTKDITRSDALCLAASLAALYLWLIVDQPLWSVILITIAGVVSYIPTARKSWNNPYYENLTLYQVSTFRHMLAIVALEQINLLTALYPAAWVFVNFSIAALLIVRRKQLPHLNPAVS